MLSDVLMEFLVKGPAHLAYKEILNQVDPAKCNVRLEGAHTMWEELEHIRIAQEDIINFMIDPRWQSPEWPAGYWPPTDSAADGLQWASSVEKFFSDLDRLTGMLGRGEIDLHAAIPHAPDYTYVREILLVIDHNSYHFAKIMQLHKMIR